MCELLGMSSRRPVRLTFSLQTLASHSIPPDRQSDGWGAVFYQGNDVALSREPIAASTRPLVVFLGQQGPSSSLAISHIRHATRGEITLANTQPFIREWARRVHVFAHSGDLPTISNASALRYDRFRPVGTTDSEQAFCALMERIAALGSDVSLAQQFGTVKRFAEDLSEFGPANFLYSDGDTLFAYGHRRLQQHTGKVSAPGLHLYTCRCEHDDYSIDVQGLSIASGFQEVAMVASVALSDDSQSWRPLAEGELLAIRGGKVLIPRSLENSITGD